MKLDQLEPGKLYKLVPCWWNSGPSGGWSYVLDPFHEPAASSTAICPFGATLLCLSTGCVLGKHQRVCKFLFETKVVWFDAYVVADGMIEL